MLTDAGWLEVFARAARAVEEAVRPLLGRPPGRVELATGAGGDRTVELDRRAEDAALAVLAELAAAGERFSVLSEEVGLVDHGAPWPLVLVDPLDGSLNAKQGLPVHAFMATLATGPTLADVRAGLVRNLVSAEQWWAIRGGGAFRDGEPLVPLPRLRPGRIELLGLESSPRVLEAAAPLVARAVKLRLLGTMAISLAHTAAGGMEVFCSPLPVRVFDMTAGALMIQEVGGVVTDIEGTPLAGIAIGLDSRSSLLCSADPGLHAEALAALRG